MIKKIKTFYLNNLQCQKKEMISNFFYKILKEIKKMKEIKIHILLLFQIKVKNIKIKNKKTYKIFKKMKILNKTQLKKMRF